MVCRPRNEELSVTVVDGAGRSLKIPAWMLAPDAAQFQVSAQAEIGPRALLSVAELLRTLVENERGEN